jgi:hypothetical protein
MAKIKVKKAEVLEAIKSAHGQKTGVCELLGISRPTLDRYLLDTEVQEAFVFQKQRRTDRAEYQLDLAIERGEAWAVQFALKNARDREYSDRMDITTGGEKIKGYVGFTPEQWDKKDDTNE